MARACGKGRAWGIKYGARYAVNWFSSIVPSKGIENRGCRIRRPCSADILTGDEGPPTNTTPTAATAGCEQRGQHQGNRSEKTDLR